MVEPFPEKESKVMPWQTLERLFCEHREAEMEQLAGIRESPGKSEGRL